MKKILTSAVFLFIWGNSQVFSQTTIDLSHNSKRTGDAIEMYEIIADNIWDLSYSEKCGNSIYERNEDFKEDTITVLFNGTRRYYEYHCDSMLYVGLENPQNMESFYLPEASCIFPMSLGNRYSGFTASHIYYCDRLSLHKYGSYDIHADSIGTLTLRNGGTIDNALQITCMRQLMYEQLDSCKSDSLPRYTESTIMSKLAETSNIYTEIEKSLYVKGYRYPIVKDLIRYNHEDDTYVKETYYSPPEEQEHLFLDEPNLEARYEQSSNEQGDSHDDNIDVFSFVTNRTDAMEVMFDCQGFLASYPQNGPIQCRLLLSDKDGIVYRTKNYSISPFSNQEVCLSYSGLRRGQYILSIIINEQIYTNNFIIE